MQRGCAKRDRVGRERPALKQRYFTSHDGTPIGYQVCGNPEGVPLLLANGLGGTATAYRFIIHRFGGTFRFLSWDYRGMYTSGRPLSGYDGLSIQDHARDAIALLEHEGVERCFALGWSMGVQVLLEMARDVGDRLDGLVLHNGVPGAPYKTLAGVPYFAELTPRLLEKLQRIDGAVMRLVRFAVDFGPFIEIMCRLGLCHHELDREVFREIAANFKQLDMHLYLEALKKLGEHDASDVLPHISCPTLLLAATHDRMTPLSVMERMAQKIPDAELKVIPGGTHYAAVEFPELINRFLEEWLKRRFPALSLEAPERAVSTDPCQVL